MHWKSQSEAITAEQMDELVTEAGRAVGGMPLAQLRNRAEVTRLAQDAVRTALRQQRITTLGPSQFQGAVSRVVARLGGLGFLDSLMPPACVDFTDVLVNGDGGVWGRYKGEMDFTRLAIQPSPQECWQAVEALLAPLGRACTEATPSVDAKIARDKGHNFAGARVKIIHPNIGAGDGYPTIALRFYENRPVPPAQIIEWGMMPAFLMDHLLEIVSDRLRVMVVGGTGTGKTTLLSALCHGIEEEARIVKIEDPEEIWLPHPNVTTLEARPAPPGSNVLGYTVSDGVDDAMRLAPSHVIVGEVRTGNAALSLFRSLMSDHAGLTTFHAEGAEEAVFRLGVILFADAGVRFEAAKGLFAQAIDLVVQLGFREGRRQAVAVHEVQDAAGGNVRFQPLWQSGDETMQPVSRRRT